MRFLFAASLLLVGVLACSSKSASNDGSSDDEIDGEENTMGLALHYDAPSGTVRATLKQILHRGQTLKLNVRRGRISADSEAALDCNALPDAPLLPPPPITNTTSTTTSTTTTTTTPAATTANLVYQGPFVDPSYLVSIYNDAWIQQNITPEMLDRISRDGADSIVEACIVRGDLASAHLQTTIAYAWDESDPNLRQPEPAVTPPADAVLFVRH